MSRKLAMTTIRAVVDGLNRQHSYSTIHKSTGASKGFISKISSAIARANMPLHEAVNQPDSVLHDLVYPPAVKRLIEPDWADVCEKLSRSHMTLQLVYEHYQGTCSKADTAYSYPSFCRLYSDWKRANAPAEPYTNLDHHPGEIMEIDFAGDPLSWVDPYAEVHRERLFVAALPYSGIFFAQIYPDEKQQSWVNGIIEALDYFGGAPKLLSMDNAKALVRQAKWQGGDIQPIITDLCLHYGMEPHTCRVRKPKDKNRVEASVANVERWIVAELQYDNGAVLVKDREELLRKVRQRLDEVNSQPWRIRNRSGSRRSRFDEEEKPFLKALPLTPYEFVTWKVLQVDKGHCIRLSCDGRHRYSVPPKYVGQTVQVKIGRTEIKIFDGETAAHIATHTRITTSTGAFTHMLPEHMTHQERLSRRTDEEWIEEFVKLGISQSVAVEFIRKSTEHSRFNAGRLFLAITTKLTKEFRPKVIEGGMKSCLQVELFSVKMIRLACEATQNAVANADSDEESQEPAEIEHTNIRGDYE